MPANHHHCLERARSWLPNEDACRQAALEAAEGDNVADGADGADGAVEDGATWPYLWPGGTRLAEDLDQLLPQSLAARRALHVVDLGCGRGLLGLVALAMGFEQVTFVDGDSAPLRLLAPQLSAFPRASCQTVVWGQAIPGPGADLILGGDVLYRPAYHDQLIATIAASLSPHGRALLGDPRSVIEPQLSTLADAHGCLWDQQQRPGPYTLGILSRGDWDRQSERSQTTLTA